jgi:hypothetical protein
MIYDFEWLMLLLDGVDDGFDVLRRIPPFDDLGLRRFGLDEVRPVDSGDVEVESDGHVKQLPRRLYVDLAGPYSARPISVLLHLRFVHDYVYQIDRAVCQQVRNAISAHGPARYDIDHYLDLELVDPLLNPHVQFLYHHALVHIHWVLHVDTDVVDGNVGMVSRGVVSRARGGTGDGQSMFLGEYVRPTWVVSSEQDFVDDVFEDVSDVVEGVVASSIADEEVEIEAEAALAPDTSEAVGPTLLLFLEAGIPVPPSLAGQRKQDQDPSEQAYTPVSPFPLP